MMKFLTVSLITMLALSFCLGGVAYAQEAEDTTLPEPGITPDSPFYFMDKWGKGISLAFTFNAAERARKALQYADENMAEVKAMIAAGKPDAAAEAANEYQSRFQMAVQNMEQARLQGEDVSEKVALMAEKHIGYTSDSTDGTTDEARKVLTQARERAMDCQETALQNMAQGDPEKAARFNLQLMERQLNRVRVQAETAANEGLRARLEAYNRLGKAGEEISQIAKGLGEETTVDQLVGEATAHHLEVLAAVRQRVQGGALEAVEAAIQNRVQNHAEIVTRLQAQNRLGQVPAQTPLPGATPGQGQMGQGGAGGQPGPMATVTPGQGQMGQGGAGGGQPGPMPTLTPGPGAGGAQQSPTPTATPGQGGTGGAQQGR
jgi:hypothetical protein